MGVGLHSPAVRVAIPCNLRVVSHHCDADWCVLPLTLLSLVFVNLRIAVSELIELAARSDHFQW